VVSRRLLDQTRQAAAGYGRGRSRRTACRAVECRGTRRQLPDRSAACAHGVSPTLAARLLLPDHRCSRVASCFVLRGNCNAHWISMWFAREPAATDRPRPRPLVSGRLCENAGTTEDVGGSSALGS